MRARNSQFFCLIALVALSACGGGARGPQTDGVRRNPPLVYPATYTELPPIKNSAASDVQKNNDVEDLLTGEISEPQKQGKPKAGSGEDALLRQF